tara:strand:- start:63 stop:290 length:228 start_codon:yes stop_codon:yes gene_type:complete
MSFTELQRQRQHLNDLLDWAEKISMEPQPKILRDGHLPSHTAMDCVSQAIAQLEAVKAKRIAVGRIDQVFLYRQH